MLHQLAADACEKGPTGRPADQRAGGLYLLLRVFSFLQAEIRVAQLNTLMEPYVQRRFADFMDQGQIERW